MAITPLPTPPQRSEPTTFADRGDAFLGALPQFASEIEDARLEIAANTTTSATNAATAISNRELADAAVAAASASANYKGLWSSLSGALAIPASVAHLGQLWVLTESLADVTAEVPGTSSKWIIHGLASVAYDNRATLRTFTSVTPIVVDGIGLFIHIPGSTEVDDDETCFATASGRWLLAAAGYDIIDAYIGVELDERITTAEQAWVKLATVSVSTAVASVSLENGATAYFTADYPTYAVVVSGVKPATDNVQLVATLKTTSYHTSGYSGQSTSNGAALTVLTTGIGGISTSGNASNEAGDYIFYLSDPTNTDTYKRVRWWGAALDTASAMSSAEGASVLAVTQAITGIKFAFSSGNIADGTFTLYGIK